MEEVFLLYEYDAEGPADTPLVYGSLEAALAKARSIRFSVEDVLTPRGVVARLADELTGGRPVGTYVMRDESPRLDTWVGEGCVIGTGRRVVGAPLLVIERAGVIG